MPTPSLRGRAVLYGGTPTLEGKGRLFDIGPRVERALSEFPILLDRTESPAVFLKGRIVIPEIQKGTPAIAPILMVAAVKFLELVKIHTSTRFYDVGPSRVRGEEFRRLRLILLA